MPESIGATPALHPGSQLRRRPRIGFVLTWPDIKNAEYEVVHRLVRSAENVGADAVIVDNDGYPLWASDRASPAGLERLSHGDVDFIISLHFESPRLYDVYSYSALWNPSEFYFLWGYGPTLSRLLSHNDLLSCESTMADVQAISGLEGMGRAPALPIPKLFHSMGGPFLEPRITPESRLFYIGINWERLGNKKGRHHDLLVQLDQRDLIHIYGPELFQGSRPWEGFRNYMGSIPFDGVSVLREINRAGICLAFSSQAHKVSGIMSNRLFEGLAAGAVIISNPHPLIERHFSDCVYVVDDTVDPDELTAQVNRIILDVRQDPKAAQERARRGQELLREYFSMDVRLRQLIDQHPVRQAAFDRALEGEERRRITVVALCPELMPGSIELLAGNITRQRGVDVDVILVMDEGLVHGERQTIDAAFKAESVRSVTILAAPLYEARQKIGQPLKRKEPLGPFVRRALSQAETDYVALLRTDEHWFGDHLASLARALDATPTSFSSRSGSITESNGPDNRRVRRLDELHGGNADNMIHANNTRSAGRALYRRALLARTPLTVMDLLDGQEHNLLALHAFLNGPISQTSYASYVYLEWRESLLPLPVLPLEQQHQFVRDTASGRQEWRYLLAGLGRPPEFVYSNSGGEPIRWEHYLSPTETARAIEVNELYGTRTGERGLVYLTKGFSRPEEQGTWIEGSDAELSFSLAHASLDFEIVLRVLGRTSTSGRPEHITVLVNGYVLGYQRIDGNQEVRFKVNPKLIAGASSWRVRIVLDHADPEAAPEGQAANSRRLGLQLQAMGVFESDRISTPKSRSDA